MKYLAALVVVLSTTCAAGDNVVPNELVQLIIDSPEMSTYWHPEMEGRRPLKLRHKYIGTSTGIVKFGREVVLVTGPDPCSCFAITGFSLKGEVWTVAVEFPPEGITGTFTATMLPDRQWKLISRNVREH